MPIVGIDRHVILTTAMVIQAIKQSQIAQTITTIPMLLLPIIMQAAEAVDLIVLVRLEVDVHQDHIKYYKF